MLNKVTSSVATLFLCAHCLPAQVSVPTAQKSNLRTNANQSETALTPSNVESASVQLSGLARQRWQAFSLSGCRCYR